MLGVITEDVLAMYSEYPYPSPYHRDQPVL
jgi:hypothetical protein